MKRILLIGFIFIVCINAVMSQQYSRKWGLVWQKERDLVEYKKDKEAEAVILYDIGESFFKDTDKNTFTIEFTRKKRIKILKNAGVKYAEVSIPYYVDKVGESEFVTRIEAYAYNEVDGAIEITKLDQSRIYIDKLKNNWYVKKFAIPNVKKGTIIEYRYVLETPFLFNLPDWQFQDKIPTIYSEYNVRMIPFYEYSFISQGVKRFDYQHTELGKHNRYYGEVIKSYGKNVGSGVEFQDLIHTYVMQDVPAFRDESYITSINDYIMQIDFQLAKVNLLNRDSREIMTTWPKLINSLNDHTEFGRYLKRSKSYSKRIFNADLIIDGLNESMKAQKIISYVKSSFSWNGVYAKYASKSPKELHTQKSGNSADINLFLVALLQEAGIEAYPVILSTRNHGKVKMDYPYTHFFNNVVAVVKTQSQTYLSDASNDFIPYNRIPPACINGKGLVINEKETKWVQLNLNPLSYDYKTIKLDINKNSLGARATVYIQSTEYEAYKYRNTLQNDVSKIENILSEGGIKNIYKTETKNYESLSLPYVILAEGDVELEQFDDQILISPFLGFPLKENQLKQNRRSYPVDFIYSKDQAFLSTINIPNNYILHSYPENFNMNSDLFDINIEYTPAVNGIEVTAKYTFKKAIYSAHEYSRLKFYINTIISKFNTPIVIKRK